VVESRSAALAPASAGSNDLLQPIERGLINADHVHAEFGELIDASTPVAPHRNRSRCTSPSRGRAGRCRRRAGLRAAHERGAGREIEL